MVEIPKSRIQSTLGQMMEKKSQPFFRLVTQGSYTIYLDECDHMEVFEGGYTDEQEGKVSVKCHVGAVYAVPPSYRRSDGSVELSNGSGILPVP